MYIYICIYIEGLPPHIFSTLAIYNWKRICNTTEILSQRQSSSPLLTRVISLSRYFVPLSVLRDIEQRSTTLRTRTFGHDGEGDEGRRSNAIPSDNRQANQPPLNKNCGHNFTLTKTLSCGALNIMHIFLVFFILFVFLRWRFMGVFFVCVFLGPWPASYTSKMLCLHSPYSNSSWSMAGLH